MVQTHSYSTALYQASALIRASSNAFGKSTYQPVQRVRASNGTLATATVLGTFPSSKKTVKNSVGRGNPIDFFRLDLSEASRITLNFVNRSGSQLNAAILDANGNAIKLNGRKQVSVAANKQTDTLVRGAQPGVYYIRIKGPASGTNRYDFNLFVNRSGSPAPLPCACGG
jgi:hypothetical protein